MCVFGTYSLVPYLDMNGRHFYMWGEVSRQRLMLLACSVLALTFAGYFATRLWAWSLIDDPGQVLELHNRTSSKGWLLGSIAWVVEAATQDFSWGLFRPSWWVYPPLVYWLPDWGTHLFRYACLLVAWSGPLVALRRNGARDSTILMSLFIFMASAYFLMWGLFTISLQELSFAAFLGLGLIFRNRVGRLICWTIAVWFKAPLAWILVGEAIILWRMGRRRLAFANAAIAAVTLVAAVLMSREGSYTSRYSLGRSSLIPMWHNALNLMDPWFMLPVIALLWWLVVTQGRLRWTSDSQVFAIGFGLYTLQMLLWGVTGHYMGGISYLFALFLTSLLANPQSMSHIRAVFALAIPAIAGLGTFRAAVITGLDQNSETLVLRNCLSDIGSTSVRVSPSYGPEAAVRLKQNVQLFDSSWSGNVELATPTDTFYGPGAPSVFIGLNGESPPPSLYQVQCSRGSTRVFRRLEGT